MASAVISVGIGIGLQALNRALAGTTKNVGPRLDEIRQTQSNLGAPIPQCYGHVRLGASLIWSGPVNEVRSTRTQSAKGLGPPPVKTVSFSYFGNFAMLVGEGEILGLRRIWADKKVVYDATGASPTFVKYTSAKLRWYSGSETQDVDPLIQTYEGDYTPAMRGLAYCVFEDFPLEDFGNRIPQMEFEVSTNTYAQLTSVPYATGDSHGYTQKSAVAVNSSVRRIYTVDYLYGGQVFDMDTGTLLQTRLRASDANWVRDIGAGGLDPSQVQAHGITTTPDGRLFMGWHGSEGRVLSELNPLDMSVVDRGVEFSPASSPAPVPYGLNDSVYTGVQILTASGLATGVWVIGSNVTSNAPAGQFGARFIWVDKEQALGRFRHSVANIETAGVEAVSGGINGWVVIDVITDANGYAWVLAYDQRRSSTGSNADLRAQIIKCQADILLNAVPLFGPYVEVSTEVFDMTPFEINFDASGSIYGDTVASFAYDEATGYFFIIGTEHPTSGTYKMMVWDPETNTEIRAKEFDVAEHYFVWSGSANSNPVQNNKVRVMDRDGGDAIIKEVDFVTFEVTELTTDYTSIGGGGSNGVSFWTVPKENTLYTFEDTNGWRRYRLGRVDTTPMALGDVIEDILPHVGFDVSSEVDVDSTLAAEDLIGFAYPGTLTAQEVMKQLAFVYLFDSVEVDGKVAMVPRGAAAAATVDKTSEGFDRSIDDRHVDEQVIQPVDIPGQIDVVYPDPTRDHQSNSQSAQRTLAPFTTQYSNDKQKIEVAVEMSGDRAAQLAEIQLYSTWSNRVVFNTELRPKFLKYAPTDVLTITRDDDSTTDARIIQQKLGKSYTSIVELVEEDPDTYQSVTGGLASAVPVDVLEFKGPTIPIIMDIPLLRDSDNSQGTAARIYAAMGTYTSNWAGGRLESSVDRFTYTEFDSSDQAAIWGYLVSDLPGYNPEFNDVDGDWSLPIEALTWDRTTSITIKVLQGGAGLASVTEAQALAGANAFYIGGEIIQAATISAGSETDEYVLTDLIRGRRGTDTKVLAGHKIGERVVFLDPPDIGTNQFNPALIGTSIAYQGVSNNALDEPQPAPTVLELAGNSLKPYLVYDVLPDAQPGSSRSPLNVSWERRERINGNRFWDGDGSVGLSESIERYEVVLLEKAGAAGYPHDVGVTFTFDHNSGEGTIHRSSGSFSTTSGFVAGDIVHVEIDGWAINNGVYKVDATPTQTMRFSADGDIGDGNAGDSVVTDATERSGRVWAEADEYASYFSGAERNVDIPEADQLAAGYSAGDRLNLMIYQLSGNGNVGRGFGLLVQI